MPDQALNLAKSVIFRSSLNFKMHICIHKRGPCYVAGPNRSRLDTFTGIAHCRGHSSALPTTRAIVPPSGVVSIVQPLLMVLVGKKVWQGLPRQQELAVDKDSGAGDL